MTLPKSPIAWVLIVVGGATALCCSGALGVMALGLFAEDDTTASPSRVDVPGAAGRTGQPGAPGGFAFDVPKGWKATGEGRYLIEEKDDQDILGVEVVRLPSVPGLEDGEGKVARLWHERIGAEIGTVAVHLLCAGRYGYYRDELYFIACGQHLAWGYAWGPSGLLRANQPPLLATFIATVAV